MRISDIKSTTLQTCWCPYDDGDFLACAAFYGNSIVQQKAERNVTHKIKHCFTNITVGSFFFYLTILYNI